MDHMELSRKHLARQVWSLGGSDHGAVVIPGIATPTFHSDTPTYSEELASLEVHEGERGGRLLPGFYH